MRSETLSSKGVNGWFNGTLFFKNCKRFWPIWLCYGLLWFFLLPVNLLGNYRWERRGFYFPRGFILNYLTPGMAVAFGMGILCAMALLSYLYNSRSAGFYHSLPIRREGLFLTNYLSGVAFFAVPILAVALITGLVEAMTCGFDLPSVFTWAWSQFWGCLFFFSFAVFCAMFTGHILALPVFYGILNVLAMVLTYVFSALVREFLFGYTDNSLMNSAGEAAKWLTPLLHLTDSVDYAVDPSGLYSPTGMGLVFVYGLIGLALAGCALAVYRRRQLERAGEMVTVGWARPLFKYGVAFCSAVCLGLVLLGLVSGVIGGDEPQMVLCMLIMGAVGYFVAEMLLEKTFHVFRKSWKGCAALLGAVVVLCLCLFFDLTGYETRVPDPAKVDAVTVYFGSSSPYDSANGGTVTLTDPALIEQVVGIHRAIVDDQARVERERGNYMTEDRSIDGHQVCVETAAGKTIYLTYAMKSGADLQREYDLTIWADDLEREGTWSNRIQALMNEPTVVEALYVRPLDGAETLDSVRLYHYADGVDDPYVTGAAAAAIYEAVQRDMAEGNFHRYLLDDADRLTNCYREDLELNFRRPVQSAEKDENAAAVPQPTSASVDTMTEYVGPTGELRPTGGPSVTVAIQKSAVHTLQALKDAGLIDSPDDLTLKLVDEDTNYCY